MAKDRYFGVDLNFFHKRSFDRLVDEFGPWGPVVWLSLVAEAKRSLTPGTVTVTSEPQFWAQLGLAGRDVGFGMDEFLAFTGRLKQTRRTNVGRLINVVLTHYGDWQNDFRRQNERTKKARKRRETRPDIGGTAAGHDPDSGGDRELEVQQQELKEVLVVQPVARPEGPNPSQVLAAALEAPRQAVVAEVCGRFEADVRQVAPLAERMTAQSFRTVADTVAERCRTGAVRNPPGLLVQLLRAHLKELAREQVSVAPLSLEDEILVETTRLAAGGYPLDVVVELLERKLRRLRVPETDWLRLTGLAMETFAQGTTTPDG